MLSRTNSAQSNLSAAAAATALKRANSQASLDHRPSSAGAVPTSPNFSRPPGLQRRRNSMSERSFRVTAPEDAAREKRDRPASVMDVTTSSNQGSIKRKGSFSLPMSLRGNSQKQVKKDN